MNISKEELLAVLARFNPWWRGESPPGLPHWRRALAPVLHRWLSDPPTHRALLVSGARQVGKTTLLLQEIASLLREGVTPGRILYATFDHPILKLAGIEAVIQAWHEREPHDGGVEYLFLDEAQFIRDGGTWIKHQVDFAKHRRIVFTGSASPLLESGQESGVGRWHTLRLPTLSFSEYVQLKRLELPALPVLPSIDALFDWPPDEFLRVRERAGHWVGHFHDYLLRGGFPQTALVEHIDHAQRLLREDIVDKALKRDMTALFGVRRVLDLEHTFLYLCLHDGGLLNISDLSSNLEVKRPTAQHFVELLEACHLVYRLPPFGYGKDILKGRFKVYLADPGIAPAVMLRGKQLLEDAAALGVATESAVFKHLAMHTGRRWTRLSYWQGRQGYEVDIIAESADGLLPFEVKYRAQHAGVRDLKGLLAFCAERDIARAFVATKSLADFGPVVVPAGETASGRRKGGAAGGTTIMRVPAPLLCWWLSESGVVEAG